MVRAPMLGSRTAATVATLVLLSASTLGCRARSPFDEEGAATVRIFRLASFEPKGTEPLPAPIQHWLGDGTSGLPAELVPPGFLVGGTPLPQWPADAPTFLGFHEVEARTATDPLGKDLIGWAREDAALGDGEGASCMYPEFGLEIMRPGGTSARVLVSLSCGQMRTFVDGQPPSDRGFGKPARARFALVVARAFRSAHS
jgi:hypothetical protein